MLLNTTRLARGFATFTVLAGMSLSTTGRASEQTSQVMNILGDNLGGDFAFTLINPRAGKPSCATEETWAITTPASDNARGLLSMIMTAFAAGKTVYVVGTGTCAPSAPARETVAWIVLH